MFSNEEKFKIYCFYIRVRLIKKKKQIKNYLNIIFI